MFINIIIVLVDEYVEINTFKQEIRTHSSEYIYENYYISGEVWVFKKIFNDNWFIKYDEFKKYISKKLGVHYHDIDITGSGKLGFSLNPKKKYKLFDDNSDIDIIIVSNHLFNEFWKQYLRDSYNLNAQINDIDKVSSCIFQKYLYLDGFRNNSYYNEWLEKTGGFEKDIQMTFRIENAINYRIFESWDAVKYYYLSNIDELKMEEE